MYITTPRKPDWTPEHFRDFLVNYPKIDTQASFHEYEEFAKQGFESKFTMRWLAGVLRKIDELYYANQLLAFISQAYGKLYIKGFVDEVQTAGFVVENDEHGLELRLNQKLFLDLFEEGHNSYHAGGLICDNVFHCVSQVLLHECIHLALTVCEKMGVYDDARHHGKTFAHIAKRMLGHCDTQHGLIKDLVHTTSLCDIKQTLVIGLHVLVFFKNRFVPAIIEKIYRKKVDVNISNSVYTVHIGLIKLRDAQ
jgi:hypothetical protein